VLSHFKPSEEGERNPYKYPPHHDQVVVLIIVPGLWLHSLNNFNPAQQRKEEKASFNFICIYFHHGKAVLDFCRAWLSRFQVNLLFGYQAQLGGRKLLVSIYIYHGLIHAVFALSYF